MSESLHLILFILLPLALAARVLRRDACGDGVMQATAVLRFCLGIGKALLLVAPMAEIALLILCNGAVNISVATAWVCLLALVTGLGLFVSSMRDIGAGIAGLFGVAGTELLPQKITLRLLLAASLCVMLAVTLSPLEGVFFLKALVWPPVKTLAVLFQDMRVWTDFHIVSLAAAAGVYFLAPVTTEFLRVWRPWKAFWSLGVFVLAAVMLWTRISPLS